MDQSLLPGATQWDKIAVFSPWLRSLVGPERPLRARAAVYRPSLQRARGLDAVVGLSPEWGDDGAQAFAERSRLPYFRVEFGILASVWRGQRFRPLSLLVDESPSPSDPPHGSAIVRTLALRTESYSPELIARARAIRHAIVGSSLSRFADAIAPVPPALLPDAARPVVIVVEASPRSPDHSLSKVRSMLERAANAHPGAPLWLVFESPFGLEQPPRLDQLLREHPRARLLPRDIDRSQVLEQAAHVYTQASRLGFEALLREIPVTVFGQPFYAGWGLTCDQEPVLRPRPASLDELVAAALILAPRYFDWILERETSVEATCAHLTLQRQRFFENRGPFVSVGLSVWKRVIVSRYLESKDNQIVHLRDAKALRKYPAAPDTKVVVWASRPHDQVADEAIAKRLPLWRMEDGFLRSVGLGSDWAAPGSLVFDRLGIYYDPRQPSELEELLNSVDLSDEERAEAEALRQLIVKLGISKYNTQQDQAYRPQNRPGQPTLLVPGQVADDASVRLGGSNVGTIETLLKTVRRLAPEAHVIYKPHPDVLSGNRRGHIDEGKGTLFDELVLDVPIHRCLERADSVHTLSSLVGFEALLRKIPVTCHGQPFYSGWGLTTDLNPLPRRTRRRTLEELVALTLVRYPRYYHFPSGSFCSAAQMAAFLALAQAQTTQHKRQPAAVRRLKSLLELAKDLFYAG